MADGRGEGHGSGRVSAHILHTCLEFFVVFCVGIWLLAFGAEAVAGADGWIILPPGLLCWAGAGGESPGAFPPPPRSCPGEAPSSLSLPLYFLSL